MCACLLITTGLVSVIAADHLLQEDPVHCQASKYLEHKGLTEVSKPVQINLRCLSAALIMHRCRRRLLFESIAYYCFTFFLGGGAFFTKYAKVFQFTPNFQNLVFAVLVSTKYLAATVGKVTFASVGAIFLNLVQFALGFTMGQQYSQSVNAFHLHAISVVYKFCLNNGVFKADGRKQAKRKSSISFALACRYQFPATLLHS